ncbi:MULTISPECIES: hypothetical protein [Bacteroidaceae]|uniref:hypothetical protein n=1 Tax=Bacteroidaceae TaxID=815 RepID=UPI001314B0EC|nr:MULTISPECIES: hypothetical protein [Bacteroidaceae]MDR3950114.1 hypothetical protein [Bacteroides sp.]
MVRKHPAVRGTGQQHLNRATECQVMTVFRRCPAIIRSDGDDISFRYHIILFFS